MVVTSMELAVSIQTTPQRLMQSLKDIKIENISNEESPLTAGEESSLTNSVQNNTIQTGMSIKIVNLFNFFVNNIILIHLLIFRHWNSQKIHNSEEYFRITHVWSWGPIYLKTSRARTKPSYHIGKIVINVQNFWLPNRLFWNSNFLFEFDFGDDQDPSSIYSWFLKSLSVLHSELKCEW